MNDYNQTLFEYVHGRCDGPSEQMHRRIRWIADNIPSGVKTVLDLGAGRGYLSNLLRDRGFQVTSLDLVFASLKGSNNQKVQASGAYLPFRNSCFDLVLCVEVIEHLSLRDRVATLREIHRVARDYVLITVPNNEDLDQMLIRCDRCNHIFHAWGHLESFDRSRMQTLLPQRPINISILAMPTIRYFRPLLGIRHKVFKTYGYDTYVVCPNCSNRDIAEPKRSLPVKVMDRLHYWLCLQSEGGWMLAIYRTTKDGTPSDPLKQTLKKTNSNGSSAFTRVDRNLTALQIKCETLEAELSWRLGRYTRKALVIAHELILKLCHLRQWNVLGSKTLVSGQAACPRDVPRIPTITTGSTTVSGRAEELLQGYCTLENGSTVSVKEISWARDSFDKIPSFSRFLFHSLDWVDDLVNAYFITKDHRYLDLAKSLTVNWVSECLFRERDPTVWDDHITALRLLILCKLWVICHAGKVANVEFEVEFEPQLISAISRHAMKLAIPGFYRPLHNHGVTQAYALLVVGLLFPGFAETSTWVDLGRARLEQQMAENVSAEGLHREHSPFYHFYVLNHFLYASQFAVAYGIEFSQRLTERIEKMLLCGAYLLKPDCSLPAIGDTSASSPVLLRPEDLTEGTSEAARRYLYSFTAGTRGAQPDANSLVFPDAGLAIFRSGWGTDRRFQDELFATVRTSTFDTSHIHRDQGSFELYAYGADLIVDSGGPYRYGDPLREFFLSTPAHNTVVVDGQNQGIGNAEIINWCTSTNLDFLVMEHRSYPNVVHRRTILFVRPYYLIIIDRLSADAIHAYTQCFHLSPNLAATPDGLAIGTTSRLNGPTLKIIPFLEEGLALKLQTGANDPVQGWVCIAEGRKVANTVVEYERAGSTVEFAVVLMPEAPGMPLPVRARMEDLPGGQSRRILVRRGKYRDDIVIANDQPVTVRTTANG